MWRNALEVPYSWLVRPRFIVYAWVLVEWAWWPGSLEWVMGGFAALLGIKVWTGFRRIRQRL